ncbi:hypothetical protein ASF23_17065 [Curtobacterium sp. Leaf261]|nr:hypothetical protein ASF23_17065 [Curtobacterium sp. Leaf261]
MGEHPIGGYAEHDESVGLRREVSTVRRHAGVAQGPSAVHADSLTYGTITGINFGLRIRTRDDRTNPGEWCILSAVQ